MAMSESARSAAYGANIGALSSTWSSSARLPALPRARFNRDRSVPTVGRPSRADFLLQPGELLASYAALRVVAYEDGFLADPPRFVQRIAAVAQAAAQELPARYALGPGG